MRLSAGPFVLLAAIGACLLAVPLVDVDAQQCSCCPFTSNINLFVYDSDGQFAGLGPTIPDYRFCACDVSDCSDTVPVASLIPSALSQLNVKGLSGTVSAYVTSIGPATTGSCQADGTCLAPGGVGDPILTNMAGQSFDFPGQPYKVFNMMTEAEHQVNALMVPAEVFDDAHPDGGSFIGGLGVKYQGHNMTATIDAQGHMTVAVDGEPIPTDKYSKAWSVDEAAMVETEPHFPMLGHVAVVTTPMLVIRIHAVQPVMVGNVHHRGHIDFAVTLLTKPEAMHGLIGQAAVGEQPRYPLGDMQFHGEGSGADYAIAGESGDAGLLGDDFRFNLFEAQQPVGSNVEPKMITRALLWAKSSARLDAPVTGGHFSVPLHLMMDPIRG